MTRNTAEVEVAGEVLLLHAGRGVYWPRQRLLAIADLHLGKGDTFRRHGVALPRGGTSNDLQRLERLLDQFQPATLRVLGDLLHGPVRASAHWIDQWLAWRTRHARLEVRVVRGNHDRALPAAQLRVHDEGGATPDPPFLFTHDALEAGDPTLHAIGGHLHPVIALRERGYSTRLPVFWLGARQLVLPAFTAFSGGSPVRAGGQERLFACADELLVELPTGTKR